MVIGNQAAVKKVNAELKTNSEKMVVFTDKTDKRGMYFNLALNFVGNKNDAKTFAANHHFGGGVEVYDRKTKSFKPLP